MVIRTLKELNVSKVHLSPGHRRNRDILSLNKNFKGELEFLLRESDTTYRIDIQCEKISKAIQFQFKSAGKQRL